MGLSHYLATKVTDYGNPSSLASRLRRRRGRMLVSMIEHIHSRLGKVDIIDLGGTSLYWRIIPEETLRAKRVRITLVNLSGQVDGGPDDIFQRVEGSACGLPQFADNAFDLVHSNSVIEHVGDWGNMRAFAAEAKRLAPSHFIQTPYYWFPIEPHCLTLFFHWLPFPLRVKLVSRFKLGHWSRAQDLDSAIGTVLSASLLDKRMFRGLFPASQLRVERFCGWPKSLLAVHLAE